MAAPLQPTRAPRVSFGGSTIAYLGNRQLTCSCGNISSSGVLIYPPERATPGQFVRVIFTLGLDWIEADALLVREATEKVIYGWGLRFLQMAPHHSDELQRFIQQRLQVRPSTVRMGGAAAPSPTRRPPPPPADSFDLKDVTPIDEIERRDAEAKRRHAEHFGEDETPVRELYREALSQLDRERGGRGRGGR